MIQFLKNSEGESQKYIDQALSNFEEKKRLELQLEEAKL